MGFSSRSRPTSQRGTRIDQLLLDMAFWVLLAQLLGTALYFTGKFSNPQVHKEFIAQFGSAMAIGLWFLAQAVRGRIQIRISAYYLPVLLLLAWSAVQTFTSVTPLSVRKWVLVAQVAVTLPVWIDLLESPRRRLLLSWAIVLIGCVMAGGALIESFGYYPHPLVSQYHRQSIGSFVGHNNPMAAYLLMASMHATGLLIRFRERSWSKIFWVILILNVYLIILSGSRGVWISLPFAVVALFLSFHGLRRVKLERRFLLRVAVSVAVCVCVVLVAIGAQNLIGRDSDTPTVLDRIRDLRNVFSGTYTRVWTMSLLMVEDHPIRGVGFAAWPQQYPFYQGDWFSAHPDTSLGLPGINQHTQRAHSDYLQLVAELGLIGLLGLLWLLAVHAREVFRFLTAAGRSIASAVGLAAMTGTLAHALVYFPFHAADSSCPFLANWALFASGRGRRERVFQMSGTAVRWVTVLAALFFLLVATRPVGKLVTADVLTGQMALPLPAGERSHYGWPYKAGAITWQTWAVDLQRKGDTESAISALREAKLALEKSLELDPNYPETRQLYGRICFDLASAVHRAKGKTNLYPEAINALEDCLQTYVWHGNYHLIAQCATILWKVTGDESYFKKAMENYLTGLTMYPVNYEAIADLGKLYHDHGNDQATLELYYTTQERFGSLEGGFVNLLYTRGGAAWRAHRIEDANFYLSVASTLDEQDTEKRFTLALFYLDQNRADAVLHVLGQHLKIQPNEMNMPARLFDTWIQHGDSGQARDGAVDLFSTIDPGPAFRDQLRMVLASFLLHGEYARADEILAQIPLERSADMAKDRALTQWLKGDVLGAMTTWWQWQKTHEGDTDSFVGITACLRLLLGPARF